MSQRGADFSMMPVVLTVTLEVLLFLRGSGAQSVTQLDAHVVVSEGGSLELRCNYSYRSSPYLYWYVQYPSQGLQLILKDYSGNAVVKSSKGFEAKLDKVKTSFHLKKLYANWSDTAQYFCANPGFLNKVNCPNPSLLMGGCLEMSGAVRRSMRKRLLSAVLGLLCAQVCCVRGDVVQQSPRDLILQEGANTILMCNSSNVYNVQWFRQNPGGDLVTLFYMTSGTQDKGRLKAKAPTSEKKSSLQIFSAETSDSAIYFCAMSHSASQAPAA
ncbi:PREDICTED: uncharacterized protein LOC101629344 [Condylura cristata]|uniref:uncharacterized protein LOC101629344 n=1 Tax=Condylura cristata TaxID=143302 RepID=UPI0006429B3F|nr:PREDICTED: uncharacterized protein LOC101629344 [Condylura cristata]